MPYIKKTDRPVITINRDLKTPGDLNYVFTLVIKSYLSNKGLKYQHINDAIGALECAKLELYRRVVSDFEDEKIEQNGDVY